VLLRFTWEERNGDLHKDENLRVSLEGDFFKGHVVLTRNDGSYQKYPVRLKYMHHFGADMYNGLIDMWDAGLLHPRLIEILLERWGGRKNDHPLRRKRLKQEEESGYKPCLPSSLGYSEAYTPRDTIRADSLLGDEGLPDMVDPSSNEGSGSQEGTEV
jgi:hypothetical protein